MIRINKKKTLKEIKSFFKERRAIRKRNVILQNLAEAKKIYAILLVSGEYIAISTNPDISEIINDKNNKLYYSTFYFVVERDDSD